MRDEGQGGASGLGGGSALLGICGLRHGIWFGRHQRSARSLDLVGATMIVLTAEELQPADAAYFPHRVVRAPLVDGALGAKAERLLEGAVAQVVDHLRGGEGGVLITCNSGFNRSAVVAAASLLELEGGDASEVVSHIRRAREGSLTNRCFQTWLTSRPRAGEGR